MDYSLGLFSPTSLLGTIALILLLYIIINSLTAEELRKEPPGPRPWPLLGNLMQLDLKRLFVTLHEMSRKYGNIFTVYFGPNKVVVLAGFKTVKEALVGFAEEFGDRATPKVLHDFIQNHGIIFCNGETWKEMRRFALTTLRDFGMGKRLAEDKIVEECHYLIQEFEKHKGKPFDTTRLVNYATSNIISSIVYGSRFEYDDPRFKNMVARANENIQLSGSASVQLYNMFPRLFYWINNRKKIWRNASENVNDIQNLITGLKETLNPERCRGFVDRFLMQKRKEEDKQNLKTQYHEKNLIFSVASLFAAGTDTTAATIRWGLLFMVKYPDIQSQVQRELDREVGSRQICVEDRKNLPYTDAVIHETQRVANIIPLSVPHKTSRDVTFQGYFIKKDTVVIPLLTSVLYDENEWESPHAFNPSHFLDKDGKFIKREAFLPFSAGRRMCLGEGLAKMELFLIFSNLLQHFRFSPAPGVREEDLLLTPYVGFTLTPSPHELCATIRS
ncbi:cytochrome P450 2K1-like [Periophthalmus magnuspinnatus]|uniref:cytochrome P450 2K1-like n=1 Tax=Periophthalmus magnuspinnatus TaxID=409849 RepID=UPI00145A047B|nr:cytochrome P450 2K1-like [Periophthalmus magnuspinnatus]